MKKNKILQRYEHRPFPLPKMPWVMQQTWKDLLFIHYKIPYNTLRALVPQELELDTYDGETWISISPFKMRNVRFRLLPPIPTAYNFLELNLRTYVKYNGRGGIYFFSLDTSSTLSALGARMAFLPYYKAKMSLDNGVFFHFKSNRKDKSSAQLEVKYKPISSSYLGDKGSLEDWLVERYCLFQNAVKGTIIEIDIHHLPWELQDAEAEILQNTLTEPLSFSIPHQQPLMHFVKYQKVLAWPIKVVGKE